MNKTFQKNLKQVSRFDSYPDTWNETFVKDICSLGRGRVISQEEIENNPGDYPVYSSQTSNNGEMGKISTFDFEDDLVTWTTDGANAGTVFHRHGQFNCTNVCGTLKPKDANLIDLEFLAYHLGRIAKNYVSYIGNPKLMNDVVGRIAFPLPTPKEQRKIAKILSTVDNLIEKTQSLIGKYQAIKQGIMHDLFTRGVVENGEVRPNYEEAPHLYKETELGWIPEEWDVGELGSFLSYISYGFTNPMPEVTDGPWMITAANVQQGFIDYSTCRHTSQEAFDRLLTKKSRPCIGDILLTKDGTLGRVAVVDREKVCINQSVAVLKPNNKTTSDFLSLLLETPKYKDKMLNDSGGSAIKHIYITVVDKMLLSVPIHNGEQQKIVSILSSLKRQLSLEVEQLNKLHKLKNGLMQDLLTGKVRVMVQFDNH